MAAVRKVKSNTGSDGDVEPVGNTRKRLTFTVKNDREKILRSLNISQDLKTVPGNPTMPSEERSKDEEDPWEEQVPSSTVCLPAHMVPFGPSPRPGQDSRGCRSG